MSESVSTAKLDTTIAVPISFPHEEVEAILRDQLIDAATTAAIVQGIDLGGGPEQIANEPFQVDSLVAITVLVAVEPILGCELPQKVVQAGGYASVGEAVERLLPAIEEHWGKHHGETL